MLTRLQRRGIAKVLLPATRALSSSTPQLVDAEQERRRLAKEIDRLVRDDAEARLPEGARPGEGEVVFQGEVGGTGWVWPGWVWRRFFPDTNSPLLA